MPSFGIDAPGDGTCTSDERVVFGVADNRAAEALLFQMAFRFCHSHANDVRRGSGEIFIFRFRILRVYAKA